MKTDEKKLGVAVCVFCEHCISGSKDFSSNWYDLYCRKAENQRVSHPVTGRRVYIRCIETNPNEDLDFLTGDNLSEEVKVDIDYSDDRYVLCIQLNKWGRCSNFERISKRKEIGRLGSTSNHEFTRM